MRLFIDNYQTLGKLGYRRFDRFKRAIESAWNNELVVTLSNRSPLIVDSLGVRARR